MSDFEGFFRRVTGHPPFPYQGRLATSDWPALLDIPTGLGKTAAVLAAWLWKRLQRDTGTGRRLVYCLPMRSLVSQTETVATTMIEKASADFTDRGAPVPRVTVLMGGVAREPWGVIGWDEEPERDQIIIGTQDMLLSRALNRGYGMSRYRWPLHFGLLHSDTLWVLDETQLMGVGVETSAQLEGLRKKLGTISPTHTLWMSATLDRRQLETVDHEAARSDLACTSLAEDDLAHERIRQRIHTRKPIEPAGVSFSGGDCAKYGKALATRVLEAHAHAPDGLTLVVVNRVDRAQAVFSEIQRAAPCRVALIHSRFRPVDRRDNEAALHADGPRIIVATQAIEAGIDVSATTLVTELAPWPSLVQRFGRCRRYGEDEPRTQILWVDLPTDDKGDAALPYTTDDLDAARGLLAALSDAGPTTLRSVEYTPPAVTRPVMRRRDLVDLFDTTPDLLGDDLDISRFIRDNEDTDVRFYWREIGSGSDDAAFSLPTDAELCAVSLASARKFVEDLRKRAKNTIHAVARIPLTAWVFDPLEHHTDSKRSRFGFVPVRHVRPGQVILLAPEAGGYEPTLGWTGARGTTPALADRGASTTSSEDDRETQLSVWVRLSAHLRHVETESGAIAGALGLAALRAPLEEAGRWHDVGKAHAEFQARLHGSDGSPPAEGLWAKAPDGDPRRSKRPGFRHELASALAYLQHAPTDKDPVVRDLVAYLVAAHHGKVRLSIRALPNESGPSDGRAFARGVWDGDELPALEFADGVTVPATTLDLGVVRLGDGSWLSRVLGLRDDPKLGPFRLALLEAIVRIADWRASRNEENGAYGDA